MFLLFDKKGWVEGGGEGNDGSATDVNGRQIDKQRDGQATFDIETNKKLYNY